MSWRLWLAPALVLAVLAFGATTASAHTWATKTAIETENFSHGCSFGNFVCQTEGDGRVYAPAPFLPYWAHECDADRRLVALAHLDDGSAELLDADRSSLTGRWAFRAIYDFKPGLEDITLTALPKDVGSGAHRHICRRETVVLYTEP